MSRNFVLAVAGHGPSFGRRRRQPLLGEYVFPAVASLGFAGQIRLFHRLRAGPAHADT
jgi:hypothetical protein